MTVFEFLIKEIGFEANMYDLCVVNKGINGKQFTILWHVDDINILHVDPKIVTYIIDKVEDKYGDIMSL